MIWLVAEDEADIRVLITTMIQVWGHQAAAFENGQKVWDWLDKLEAGDTTIKPPELVLMDIRMPGKKGNELAARMRTLPAFNHTPIVLMTAFAMTDAERDEMIERDGVDRIIQKPLPEFDQLRQLLHNMIEARRSTVADAPPPAADEPAKAAPSKSAAQPASPPLPTEKQPEDSDQKASVPKSL